MFATSPRRSRLLVKLTALVRDAREKCPDVRKKCFGGRAQTWFLRKFLTARPTCRSRSRRIASFAWSVPHWRSPRHLRHRNRMRDRCHGTTPDRVTKKSRVTHLPARTSRVTRTHEEPRHGARAPVSRATRGTGRPWNGSHTRTRARARATGTPAQAGRRSLREPCASPRGPDVDLCAGPARALRGWSWHVPSSWSATDDSPGCLRMMANARDIRCGPYVDPRAHAPRAPRVRATGRPVRAPHADPARALGGPCAGGRCTSVLHGVLRTARRGVYGSWRTYMTARGPCARGHLVAVRVTRRRPGSSRGRTGRVIFQACVCSHRQSRPWARSCWRWSCSRVAGARRPSTASAASR